MTKGARSLRAEFLWSALKDAHIPLHSDGKGIPVVSDPDKPLFFKMNNTIPEPTLILWGDHVYTVIGFDAQTNMIILRNPYGSDSNPRLVKPRPRVGYDDSGNVDDEERKRYVEDLGEGQIKVKLNVIYPYIRKLLWTVL